MVLATRLLELIFLTTELVSFERY